MEEKSSAPAAVAELSTPLGMAACKADAEMLRFVEDITSRADEVQAEVLTEILRRDADTEYLRRHGMGGATDRETFKSKIPVVTYEDLLPDILRIAGGDRSPILCSDPITEFFRSSGTSGGNAKLIPATEKEKQRQQFVGSVITAVKKIFFPSAGGVLDEEKNNGKGLCFFFTRSETKTAAGISVCPSLTSTFKSEEFRRAASHAFTGPVAAILCPDVFQSMYTQLLCGLLRRREVTRIATSFAPVLLRAVRFLQLHWRELAADIAAGALTDKVSDPAVRAAVAEVMTRPDPELAGFIADQCSGDDWQGIIPRIWSDAKYLESIVTGAMAQYVPMLEFYGGGLPIVSSLYASSEGYFGVNLRPLCGPQDVSYTLMPNVAYFEFIPLEYDPPYSSSPIHPDRGTVDLAGVEVGKEYELVVTTYNGLWRYRVGDVLRVSGFHNAAPEYNFVRRSNVILSVDTDKTDESELQAAVKRASALLYGGATVVDYTSRVDTSAIPGHYVIYLELLLRDTEAAPPPPEVMEACCLEMEEAMGQTYRVSRGANGVIAPLEIRVVAPGTFEELMDFAVSSSGNGGGGNISQYKMPRCVTSNGPLMGLLDERVISAHFSPACPKVGPA